MGRIGRSFQLVGQSYRVLMQDKELMLLPLISGAIICAAVVGVAFGFGLATSAFDQPGVAVYLGVLLLYIATYAIGIFFQAAVVAGATERMRGGDPTVSSALAAARRRLGPILMWSVVAGTVGLVLRAIEERVGFVGKIIVSLVGAAWSLATLFVVPVLVLEGCTVGEAVGRSTDRIKRTWGEAVVGSTGLGAAAICAWLTLVAVVGLLAWAGAGLVAVAVMVVGAIGLMVFFTALQGVYVASLYQYATGGRTGLDADLLREAFAPRK
jgi:hypothetical protein